MRSSFVNCFRYSVALLLACRCLLSGDFARADTAISSSVKPSIQIDSRLGGLLLTARLTFVRELDGGGHAVGFDSLHFLWGSADLKELVLQFSAPRRGRQDLTPKQELVGHTALLYLLNGDKGLVLSSEDPGLAPTATSLYIWESDSPMEVEEVAQFSQFFKLPDTELRRKMLDYVDGGGPDFLKSSAMSFLWYADTDLKVNRDADSLRYIEWRDSPRLSWKLRVDADYYASTTSPKGYSTNPERLKFLRAASNAETLQPVLKRSVQSRLEEAKKGQKE